MLQLACLEADLAILDEIDSGLDIDALRDVSRAVNSLKQQRPDMGILMVTHYKVSVVGGGWWEVWGEWFVVGREWMGDRRHE